MLAGNGEFWGYRSFRRNPHPWQFRPAGEGNHAVVAGALAKTMTLSYQHAMANRALKPVTVTLGPLGALAKQRVAAGDYASVSEVVRAGLRALEREERALDAVLKARVEEALADLAPTRPQGEVFAALAAHHAARTGA